MFSMQVQKRNLKLSVVGLLMVALSACASSQSREADGNGPATPGSQRDLQVNVGDRVFFDYDSYSLAPAGQATLERQAQWLKQYSDRKIVIEGHCDERGTREYNLALGARRANAARNYLISLGISAGRIETISYGKERPEALGSTASAWSQNRRSVTVVRTGPSS